MSISGMHFSSLMRRFRGDSPERRAIGIRILTMFLVVFSVFTSFAQAAGRRSDAVTLQFGVVPQQSATRLARTWTPMLLYLSKKTGYRIIFNTARDIPTFEERCADGLYDISFMNPYHYLVFHDKPGYKVFAKENIPKLHGIIVVKVNSPYTTLEALHGEKIAFPSPAAFAASILTRAHLVKLGIPYTPQFVSSHDSVYLSVARGLYAAGGGVPRTFNNMASEIKSKLRILWKSEGYPSHAVCAHPRVSDKIVQKLKRAMAAMASDAEGIDLLKRAGMNGFTYAQDAEYDTVRALGITVLDDIAREGLR